MAATTSRAQRVLAYLSTHGPTTVETLFASVKSADIPSKTALKTSVLRPLRMQAKIRAFGPESVERVFGQVQELEPQVTAGSHKKDNKKWRWAIDPLARETQQVLQNERMRRQAGKVVMRKE